MHDVKANQDPKKLDALRKNISGEVATIQALELRIGAAQRMIKRAKAKKSSIARTAIEFETLRVSLSGLVTAYKREISRLDEKLEKKLEAFA